MLRVNRLKHGRTRIKEFETVVRNWSLGDRFGWLAGDRHIWVCQEARPPAPHSGAATHIEKPRADTNSTGMPLLEALEAAGWRITHSRWSINEGEATRPVAVYELCPPAGCG